MTEKNDKKTASNSMEWMPSKELMSSVVETLKGTSDNIWEKLKAIELRGGGEIDEETVTKLYAKLTEVRPKIVGVQIAIFILQLRLLARKEAGIKD